MQSPAMPRPEKGRCQVNDYQELRKKAEVATSGPWKFSSYQDIQTDGSMAPGNLGAVFTADSRYLTVASSCWDGDAMYIAAASPDVVLALLDEVERLRAWMWQDFGGGEVRCRACKADKNRGGDNGEHRWPCPLAALNSSPEEA